VAADSGNLIVAMIAIAMGFAFWSADRRSPTSRALAVCLAGIGATILVYELEKLGVLAGWGFLWQRLGAVCEAGAAAAGYEWILRIGRTNAPRDQRAQLGEGALRVAQGLAAIYAALGLAFPAIHDALDDRGFALENLADPGVLLFAGPFYGSLLLSSVRVAQLLLRDLDLSERIRLFALVAATPFLVSGLVLAPPWETFSMALGELIFLTGAVHYHVHQGQRGEFLARFLSPQVAQLVRERGLASTLQQSRVQLSVVACDLRGFTAFSETAAPEDVFHLLRQYYESIGDVATEFGGTIKDLAGDGVLCLVGAPLAYDDYAARAVTMALAMRERGGEVLERWKRLGLDLGIGIGVASGFATVGAIAAGGRLEYGAVGPPVNLASRLCDRAANGQILVDQRTVGLIDEPEGVSFRRLGEEELKGFARSVPIFEAAPLGGTAKLFAQTIPRLHRRFWKSLLAGDES
jgi:class 3 adenylate cyclase